MKLDFLTEARRLQPELSQMRRQLHKHPELSWQESLTTRFIEGNLQKLGARIIPWGAATGVVALLKGELPGPTVAIRADIDALPIEEKSAAVYASAASGIMHACGHDAHVACALGAARILSEHRNLLSGTVKFIFQPAEESGGGADLLIQKGALANPAVSAVFALHCQPSLPAGSLGLREGPLMAANDLIDIFIYGKSGHGAMPHLAQDPLVAAAAVVQALTTLTARSIDPLASAVISFGKIAGGSARNIIPALVELSGTIRTLDPAVRAALLPQVKNLAEQVAAAYGTKADVRFAGHFPAVVNPPTLTAFCRQALAGSGIGIAPSEPVTVTEDFSQFQQKVPGVMIWLGTGNPDKGITEPLHSDRFDIDEDALAYGAAALATLAFAWLEDEPSGGGA
jgi:amidohydrolase